MDTGLYVDITMAPMSGTDQPVAPLVDEEAPVRRRKVANEGDLDDALGCCAGTSFRITLGVAICVSLLLVGGIAAAVVFATRHGGGAGNPVDPEPPETVCITSFGSRGGVAFTVESFSNCNESYISNEPNYCTVPGGTANIVSGMKFQCVEYARRFLVASSLNKMVRFASVVGAADIWSLTNVSSVLPGNITFYSLDAHTNGTTTTPPAVGDMIIYPRQDRGFPFGHVTVVVVVEADFVGVAEENWSNDYWPAANAFANGTYARRLARSVGVGGAQSILDPAGAINGWMRVGGPIP